MLDAAIEFLTVVCAVACGLYCAYLGASLQERASHHRWHTLRRRLRTRNRPAHEATAVGPVPEPPPDADAWDDPPEPAALRLAATGTDGDGFDDY